MLLASARWALGRVGSVVVALAAFVGLGEAEQVAGRVREGAIPVVG